jgi:sulfite reductase alpha subunit-like flavoprotein
MVLIFGCRCEEKDFYYSKEWKEYSSLQVLTAFSRDNPDGSKTYVQHVIKREAEILSRLICEEKAVIYVSGRAKNMPKSVEKAFIEVVKHGLSTDDEDQAKQYL